LQLNSNYYHTNYQSYINVEAFEQFIFNNNPGFPAISGVTIQYWLINFGQACPTNIPWKETISLKTGIIDCFYSAPITRIPTPLNFTGYPGGTLSLEGYSNNTGDGVILCTYLSCITATSTPILNLGSNNNWNNAEFNIFGASNSTQAVFNSGTSISLEDIVYDYSGAPITPVCNDYSGTTETNNLNLLYCQNYSDYMTLTESNSAASSVEVLSVDSSNNPISGYYTTLSQSGIVVQTGYTPVTFNGLSAGQVYAVDPQDYGGCNFNHWADTLSTTASRSFTATSGVQVFTAIYSGTCP
jgi:hypothetical protein